ncbi:MAG: hypothetical protein ACRDHM_07475 [Actinomycetota bacterium]
MSVVDGVRAAGRSVAERFRAARRGNPGRLRRWVHALARAARGLRPVVVTLVELAGMALLSLAAYEVARPFGLAVAGLCLIVAAYAWSRPR